MRGALFICFCLVFAVACKKSTDNSGSAGNGTPPGGAPAVLGISPDSGIYGSQVTISGKNFSKVLSEDAVSFNGVQATVVSATDTTLVVVVPKDAGKGTVTVTVKGVAITPAQPPAFEYVLSATVSTIAGTGDLGYQDGAAGTAQFANPTGIAVDAHGNLYVADAFNNRIRKITPDGTVSTLAGDGVYGFADGPGNLAEFKSPYSLALDGEGNVYVADYDNNRIRKITPGGVVSTWAGNGVQGFADGPATTAEFDRPVGLTVNSAGDVYVTDSWNNRVRRISAAGLVTTVAGSGVKGFAEGPALSAQFDYPCGLGFDATGNLFIADENNVRIRKMSPDGTLGTLTGTGIAGFFDSTLAFAQFYYPKDLVLDKDGNIFVANAVQVRKITPDGIVSTLAGGRNSNSFGYADGPGKTAVFDGSTRLGIAVDANGIIYIADDGNNRIRKIIME